VTAQRFVAALATLIVAAVVGACATSARRVGSVQRTASPVAHLRPGPPVRVAIVIMENEEYGNIIGSPQMPFVNRLASRYALATQMFATAHPSLPNYLALTGGSTFGIDSDCSDCTVHASGLANELTAARISWRAYMEDLPHPCFTGASSGDYAEKHDPFVYYRPLMSCDNIVGLGRLAADESDATMPRFSWITPNLCHDMHDCSPSVGDRFLSRLVPPLLRGLGRRGLLIITWDEGTSDDGCCRLASGGHIATILAGLAARRAARLDTPVDQYSILQTVEDLLGLPRLRGAACPCTPTLAPLLNGG
jgi:hypothetical protein